MKCSNKWKSRGAPVGRPFIFARLKYFSENLLYVLQNNILYDIIAYAVQNVCNIERRWGDRNVSDSTATRLITILPLQAITLLEFWWLPMSIKRCPPLKFRDLKMYIVASAEVFRLWRIYPRPAPDKRACRSSGGGCEADSMSYAHWASSQRALHKYDANYCIIFMQRYRSGHNGADSKSVCAKSTRGFESLPLRQ